MAAEVARVGQVLSRRLSARGAVCLAKPYKLLRPAAAGKEACLAEFSHEDVEELDVQMCSLGGGRCDTFGEVGRSIRSSASPSFIVGYRTAKFINSCKGILYLQSYLVWYTSFGGIKVKEN